MANKMVMNKNKKQIEQYQVWYVLKPELDINKAFKEQVEKIWKIL